MFKLTNFLRTKLGILVSVVLLFFLFSFISPLKNINWGSFSLNPASTITVTGEAKTLEKSQIARFTAGVTTENKSKEEAINETNAKMAKIISLIKDFGIDEKDVKTQNVSVYETEAPILEIQVFPPPRGGREKVWVASNSVAVTLRDVDLAGDLADVLNASEATNVNGPNFALDDTSDTKIVLMESAIEDARKKAETIAKASGGRLGGVVNVVEGTSQSGVFRTASLEQSGGAPIEPGSQNVYQSVTVTFELR